MEPNTFGKFVVKVLLWILMLGLLIGGVVFWYCSRQVDTTRGPFKTEKVITIGKGEGATVVAATLEREGIVANQYFFLFYLMRAGLDDKLQSGQYALSGDLAIPEIVDRLVQGKVIPPGVKITFPEGFTAEMMAERLTAAGLPGKEFLNIVSEPFSKWRERFAFLEMLPAGTRLEGYLFPDTYIFPREATAELIVNELLKTFQKKALPLLTEQAGKTTLSPYQSLILASILEEEGKNYEERRIISDIFLKRLAKGQPLQSDATVNYALGTSKMQPSLNDIGTASPYNTYQNSGLPPTPISNPGVDSISAALDPTPNDYYYFLNDLKTGETVFSRTFEEHVANRSKHGL